VAALALGALTQGVDEGLPGLTPPPELDAQWQAAVAHHEAVKALGARWLLGQVEVAEVSEAFEPEGGAYGGQGHHHDHEHGHSHDH